MRDLIVLLVHLITTVLRIARPGGLRSVVAESVLIKHQLLIVSRSRRRAPNLRALDRLIAGLCSLWINDPQETRKGRAEVSPHWPQFSTGIRTLPTMKQGEPRRRAADPRCGMDGERQLASTLRGVGFL